MKKTLLMAFAISAFALSKANAQDSLSTASPQIAQSILKKIDYELNLTAQQKTEVYALLLERSNSLKQTKAAARGTQLTKTAVKPANDVAINKLKLALTPEQYRKFMQLRTQALNRKQGMTESALYKTEQDLELDF